MNQKLANAAKQAVYEGAFELSKGYCSRFCRQVTESVYGDKYSDLFGGSAIDTGERFSSANMVTSNAEVGDFLIKMGKPFGHIGIYVGDNKVAENSSTRIGRIRGALGFRSLEQYGAYQVTGRIQEEQVYNKLFFKAWSNYAAMMPVIDAVSYVRVRTLGTLLNIDVDWNQDDARVIWGGHEIEAAPKFFYDESYLPLRTLVGNAYSIAVDDNKVLLTPKS